MLEDVFCFHDLARMFHLVCMLLDPPWDVCCSCGMCQRRRLWRTGRVYKFVTGDHLVRGFLYWETEETIISSTRLWLDSWHIGLDLVVNYANDLVINDPLKCCVFLEGVFTVNLFGFVSHSCFWFLWLWWAESRRGSILWLMVAFGLSGFGEMICVGIEIVRV